jgi:hypothetical protein
MRAFYLVTAVVLGSVGAQAAPASDLTLSSSSGYIIPVQVNGHTLRMKVDPGASGYIILNPGAAKLARLKGSLIGSKTSIGPVTLYGKTDSTTIGIEGVTARRRVAWLDRNITDVADGVISPEALPHETVTFLLDSSAAGSVETINIPVDYEGSEGIYFPFKVGQKGVIVRFSMLNERSLATASAAAEIAARQGAAWGGAGERAVIRFGVERPVRPLRLERPANMSGFAISEFLVRTNDNPGEQALPSDPVDSEEIVVTGKSKRKQGTRLALMVGMDRLSACTSITYRKAVRTLSLQCSR